MACVSGVPSIRHRRAEVLPVNLGPNWRDLVPGWPEEARLNFVADLPAISILQEASAEKGGGRFVMAHIKDDPACDARALRSSRRRFATSL
jgi:hypothetical protein